MMSEATIDENFSQRLMSTLIHSGIMIVVILTSDATRAWFAKIELLQTEFLGFGLLIIWGVTSVIVVRRTGLIHYSSFDH